MLLEKHITCRTAATTECCSELKQQEQQKYAPALSPYKQSNKEQKLHSNANKLKTNSSHHRSNRIQWHSDATATRTCKFTMQKQQATHSNKSNNNCNITNATTSSSSNHSNCSRSSNNTNYKHCRSTTMWHMQHQLVMHRAANAIVITITIISLMLLGNNFHGTILTVQAHDVNTPMPMEMMLQSTTPMQSDWPMNHTDNADDWIPTTNQTHTTTTTTTTKEETKKRRTSGGGGWAAGGSAGGGMSDSIFMFIARRFSTGNDLWDGILRDCYQRPSFACFQKNVYSYLSDAFDASDVNVTQHLKFYRNAINYDDASVTESSLAEEQEEEMNENELKNDGDTSTTEAGERKASTVAANAADNDEESNNSNALPRMARSAASPTHTLPPESPIEEVTNALYGKSIKFAMTHDVELKLPEMLFDGATFRISPKQIEGNGIIAKLELIPKQEIEARLAGKIIMKKIQKFLRSKVLLSLVALVLIIKIIKIKLFWLLPLVIGVGAAKKLLLKFLLFLFPALSHLFKLCSYYQQTYHTTKYHHHHHLINHHHTIVPAWHNAEHDHHHHNHPGPELIYTQPPKGHISAYLHGAPIHETYGPPSREHYDNGGGGGWENSGPGLGSEYINDINRIAHVDESSNNFIPHTKDVNTLHAWGLGTTQPQPQSHQQQHNAQKQQQQQQQRLSTQQQRPPIIHHSYQQQQQQQAQLKPQNYQKPHATSNQFNPFQTADKQQQSIFLTKQHKGGGGGNAVGAHSAPHPVYTPTQRNAAATANSQQQQQQQPQGQGLTAAQIAAQYEPNRKQQQQQQQQLEQQKLQQQLQQLPPELSAQLKEAIRIQAEQRIIAQQQKILEHQPFVQDGQPIMPKNYDPFYTPILQKIDKILEQLGVSDDLCKERLVCSMYKDPTRYSPHSNFLSAELSRDTSELEPVTNANPAVSRFHRLTQAARDGQDQKDCLRLYPNCNVNTE